MFKNLCLSDLTKPELDALRSYKAADETADGQSKCFDLNRGLRNGLQLDELSEDLRKTAEALDSVFKRCPRLEGPATVFRGVGERRYFPIHEIGTRFRSFQYWSTTAEEDKTESFMKPSERPGYGAVFELNLPKGFPAYNMETLDGFGGHEAELLLPRNVMWRVDSCQEKEISLYLREYFVNVGHVVLTAEKWD